MPQARSTLLVLRNSCNHDFKVTLMMVMMMMMRMMMIMVIMMMMETMRTMMMLTLGCLLFASYHSWQMDSPIPSGCQGTCCTSNVEEVLHRVEMLSGPYIGPSAYYCTSRWTCSSSLRSSPPRSLPPCWLHSSAGCLPWWGCASMKNCP